MSKQILVIGNARGGTTATCGVVRTLGVPFPGANDNHENQDLYLNFFNKGEPTIVEEYNQQHPEGWGAKIIVPRDWENLQKRFDGLSNPHVICVWRDPIAVSTRGRDAPVDNKLHLSWIENLKEQIARVEWLQCDTSAPVLHISYEKLCAKIPEQVENIRKFLDLPTTKFRDACNYIRPGHYWPWNDKDDPVKRYVTHRIEVEPAILSVHKR